MSVYRNDLFDCLETMIKWTKQKQYEIRDFRNNISDEEYMKEYCSVKFTLPRQSGHTYMGLKLFKNKTFESPLYLVPNYDMLKNVYMTEKDLKYFNGNMGTINDLEKFKGIDMDLIIVDCVSTIPEEKIKNLYNVFKSCAKKNPFVILFLE